MNPYDKHLLISNSKYSSDVGGAAKTILDTFRSVPADKWIIDPQPDASFGVMSRLDDGKLALIYCARVARSDGLFKIVFLSTFPEGKNQDADQYLDLEELDIQFDKNGLDPAFFPDLFASLIVIDHEELDAIDIPQKCPASKSPYPRIYEDLIMSIYTQLPPDHVGDDTETVSIWRHSENQRWYVEAYRPNILKQPYDLSAIARPLPSIYNLYVPGPSEQDPQTIRIQASRPIDIISVKENGIDPISSMIAIQRITRLIDTYARS